MSEPFLGELRIVSFNFAPKGWAMCNGQILRINQNQALFALLGTMYGGDGNTTFALPNLQSRVPVHQGTSSVVGQASGQESHTLLVNEIPSHTHSLSGTSAKASLTVAAGDVWASDAVGRPYNATPGGTAMDPTCTSVTGAGQAHENRPPFLVLNVVIALEGIFPSRS